MYISKRNLVLLVALLLGLGLTGFLYASNPDLAKSSTLQSVVAANKLKMCSDVPFSPFEFKDNQGNFVGFDVDIARFAVRALFGIGTADGSPVRAKDIADETKLINDRLQVVVTGFDVIIPAINQGNCDVILSDITATLSRAIAVNFSAPYVETGQITYVNNKDKGKVSTYDDLDKTGIIIDVQTGTTGELAARARFPQATIRGFQDAELALQDVVNGTADAIVFDDTFLKSKIKLANVSKAGFLCCPSAPPGSVDDLQPLTKEKIAIAIRQGDPDFLTWLNLLVSQMEVQPVDAELKALFNLSDAEALLPLLKALQTHWLINFQG